MNRAIVQPTASVVAVTLFVANNTSTKALIDSPVDQTVAPSVQAAQPASTPVSPRCRRASPTTRPACRSRRPWRSCQPAWSGWACVADVDPPGRAAPIDDEARAAARRSPEGTTSASSFVYEQSGGGRRRSTIHSQGQKRPRDPESGWPMPTLAHADLDRCSAHA